MMIGAVGSSYYTPYINGAMPAMATGSINGTSGIGTSATGAVDGKGAVVNPGESTQVQPGKKSSPAECQTCKERKYQDGSDEMVSFKSASHISPESSGAKVMAHEQEHVKNAYAKAAKGNGKVLQASVSLKMAVCPECGRSYVAGGQTTTKISYPKDKFSQNKKSFDSQATKGANIDLAV